MSKILNHYENDMDKVWYNSSTIIYSECDDKDNELKTVRITFKDGRTYEYKEVKVNDYLLFREASSQGKALNTYIKSYECSKIEPIDIEKIKEELYNLQNPSDDTIKAAFENVKITIIKGKEEIYSKDNLSNETLDTIKEILNILNIKIS